MPVATLLITLEMLIILGRIYLTLAQSHTKVTQPPPSPTPNINFSFPIDCQTSIDCLISASENCSPAKALYSISSDLLGVKQTTTPLLEITGEVTGKCLFYLRTERVDLEFPANTSQEVTNQQKEIFKKLEGRDGTCEFNTGDLREMLPEGKKVFCKAALFPVN